MPFSKFFPYFYQIIDWQYRIDSMLMIEVQIES